MPRSTSPQMSFPRFWGAVRNLILFSTAVYIAVVLLWAFAQPRALEILEIGGLSPEHVRHGWVWQLLTYGFLDLDPWHFLFAMLGVFFLGSAVQQRVGSRAFVELYLSSIVGAGLVGCLLSWTGYIGQGGALGAGVAVNAILMAFYLLNRDAPIMLLFIPIPIPVKYIVIFTAAVEGAYLLISHFALYFIVLLLGMSMGYVWCRLLWRHSIVGSFQSQVSSMRNSYYRWKRDRAAKKFKVYMRNHTQDPKDHFDEGGNFPPPDDKDKKNGEPVGVVN